MKSKVIIFLSFMVFSFFSCGGGRKSAGKEAEVTVVATSSWTAAYARAAGAENILVLAPIEMNHPSEYELRPGDIPKLMKATIIIYAGYEVMTARLQKGLDIPPEKLLQIDTDYNYESIAQTVTKLAFKLGTENKARENLIEIRHILDEGKRAVREKHIAGEKVVVHRFQTSLAKELGLVPVFIFGPVAPEAADILSVSKANVTYILDNRHNPVGLPFREVLPYTLYKQLINFPGHLCTKTLSDVIRYNISQIIGETLLK